MPRERVKGAARLSRKLKRLPEAATEEVRQEIELAAAAVLQSARSRVRVSPWWRTRDAGHLRDALEVVLSRKGLRARVGVIRSKTRKLFFYARFLEFGTKHAGKMPFLFPAYREHRERIRAGLHSAVQRAFDKTMVIP